MGTQVPSPYTKSGGAPTQFLAHVYCGQMAGWMKTPLGTEVDLGLGHIVLDWVPAPAKGAQQPSPSFRPMSIVATVANLCYCYSALVSFIQKLLFPQQYLLVGVYC